MGLFYDRNERILAENRPVFSLEVTPEKVKDMDDTIRRLQNFLTITPEQIERFNKERRQTRRFNSIPILSQLTEEQAAKFSVQQHNFKGVAINASLKRHYPYGGAHHVIGYVSRINDKDMKRLIREEQDSNYQATRDIGKIGIERYYESLLHGTPVSRR